MKKRRARALPSLSGVTCEKFDAPAIPWTTAERNMLVHCARTMDWEQTSRCVQHLGNRVGRGALDCATEYARLCSEWSKRTRVVATPQKLGQEQRAARLSQLGKRIRARDALVQEMERAAKAPRQDAGVLRLVGAVERNVETARMYGARPGGLRGWWTPEEPVLDADDGFGPFPRPEQPRRTLPPTPPHTIEPFEALPLRPPVVAPSVWPLPAVVPPAGEAPVHERETALLLPVFESIAGHRISQMLFSDPVTDAAAPGYSAAVLQPMCLKHIRDRLHDGRIVTIQQLYWHLHLMLCNALMFNAPESDVYNMAQALLEDVKRECEPLLVLSVLLRFQQRNDTTN